MKSEQAMWMVLALALCMAGCQYRDARKSQNLFAPYGDRQVWAVAPLRNESGSLHADGFKAADQLAQRLETVMGLDVLSVNRVLAAMQSLKMQGINSTEDAIQLRGVLGTDALVVGTITAYDPYDPPKLGLAIELYIDPLRESLQSINVRKLVRAATDEMSLPAKPNRPSQPVSVVSGFYDAADPRVHQELKSYALSRGADGRDRGMQRDWHLIRIDLGLYTEFVTYLVCQKLLRVEEERLAPPRLAAEPAS